MTERAPAWRRGGAFAAVTLASAGLFLVSRGKWSDAIIDSGREWIVPDALSRGELLYRDVVYWFGPFTPYLHAGFFRFFGSSFRTLALAGACAAVAVLAVLAAALRQVADRRQAFAWLALAIPLLVFMPDAGGAILGMGFRIWHAAGFSLLAVILANHRPDAGARADFASGAAAGLAGLCRTEWGIAALLAASLALHVRAAGRAPVARAFARMFVGFVIVFAGGLGLMARSAGFDALLRDAPVLLVNLPEETRSRLTGIDSSVWIRGGAQMVYGVAVWVAAFRLLELLALWPSEREATAFRLRRLGLLVLLLAICVLVGGFPAAVQFAGAPLLCAASVLAGIRSPGQVRGAALAGFGALGLLTSYRRLFFITDGPYVAPPLLFAIVCAAGWAARALEAHEEPARRRLSSWLSAATACLAAGAFAVRALEYRSDDRVPVAGTGGMLSARPDVARRIEGLAESIRRGTAAGDGLVVFPEGELLNFLSGRRNPIRHRLYLPGYVNRENEEEILEELSRARPAAVVIWPRPLGEYGRAEFGSDYATSLRAWVREHYVERPFGSGSVRPPILALRKSD